MNYTFTLRTIFPYFDTLAAATEMTLFISVLAILISLAIGTVVAVMRRSRHGLLRFAGAAYVEVMRNTPLLVILYIVYFATPAIGIRLSPFTAALLGLSLNAAGYMAEIIRAGLIAVPRGQFEAATSQGMTTWQMFRHIIFPQVFRTIYAPLGNQFIAVILASSLASVIARRGARLVDADGRRQLVPLLRDLRGGGGRLRGAVPGHQPGAAADRADAVPPAGGTAMNGALAVRCRCSSRPPRTTIWLSWLALLIGAVGGSAIALLRTSRFWPLRLVALFYTEAFRSVPILIVLFFAYFGFPVMLGIDVSPFMAATFALALHASANMSRGGARRHRKRRPRPMGGGPGRRACAMRQVMRYIVAPQALRVILPPSVGVYITVLKESSLASIIGYVELTRTGLMVRETNGGGFGPLLALGVIYFLMSYGISLCGVALERRYAVGSGTIDRAVVGGMA